ncbi:MAG: DUF6515 family protein [Syntrophales bacterium]|nr:DUF6515 family protein [Syntrophales bacterium]
MSRIYRTIGHFAPVFIWVVLTVISLSVTTTSVYADERGSHHHEFRDARHGHDHYYPARGGYIDVLPRDHRVVVFGRDRFFFSGGVWYRPYGARFVIIAPPVGVVIPILPPYYTMVRFGGVPYYYANDVYYMQTPDGYRVVNPPPGAAVTAPAPQGTPAMPLSAPAADKTFIYPRQGQSEKQQATDRYECHRWAAGQTGYDPTQSSGGTPEGQLSQKREDYQRAQAACLDGRGYTVK